MEQLVLLPIREKLLSFIGLPWNKVVSSSWHWGQWVVLRSVGLIVSELEPLHQVGLHCSILGCPFCLSWKVLYALVYVSICSMGKEVLGEENILLLRNIHQCAVSWHFSSLYGFQISIVHSAMIVMVCINLSVPAIHLCVPVLLTFPMHTCTSIKCTIFIGLYVWWNQDRFLQGIWCPGRAGTERILWQSHQVDFFFSISIT